MNEKNSDINFLDGIRRIIEPLDTAFTNEKIFNAFLKDYGWQLTLSSAETKAVRDAFGITTLISQLDQLFEQLESDSDALVIVKEIITIVPEIFKVLKNLSGQASLPSPFDQNTFWDEFIPDVMSDLILDVIEERLSVLYGIMTVVGLFESRLEFPVGPNRVGYTKRIIHWDRLDNFITDPLQAIKDTYRWGNVTEGLDHQKFVSSMDVLLTQWGFSPNLEIPNSAQLDTYFSLTNPSRSGIRQISIPFILEIAEGFNSFAEIGLSIMPINVSGDLESKPHGFLISPLINGNVIGENPESMDHVTFESSASFKDGSLARLEIRPESIDFVGPATPAIALSASLTGKPDSAYILVGAENSHRIELEGFLVSLSIEGRFDDIEVIFKAGTSEGNQQKRLRFIFQAGEGDGFIKDILQNKPHVIDVSGYIAFSSKHGIGINGNVGFQLQFPLHLSLGPIQIETLQIETKADSTGTTIVPIGINVSSSLGPLIIVIENIGAKLALSPRTDKNDTGILGNLEVEWGFNPPTGVGLAIDAGAVKGGGFLRFDSDKEEYEGMLDLDLSGIIAVKAIGLITTRMPDGAKGFSLLLIITAEFASPIQLGLGFKLMAVGGLLGLNRTMRLEAIAAGIRDGGINSVMFPQNIVENAPRIISDLKKYFPVEEGTFLIGPMLKIGWGTPTLVTISVGIIIEIPGNIAILGVLKVILPDEEAPLIVIQVNFIGAIEFDKQRLWFFAAIFESRILYIPLEGEMGLLVSWGNDSNFVVSVGGFHPAFNPPPLPFGAISRIAISLLNTDDARIRVLGYFAVTSNTVQFGAKAEVFFKLSAFKIDGHLAFDALFRFSPFYFIIAISASLSVKVFGVGLFSVGMRVSLEGPTPWHVNGRGSISLFFFDIDVPFSITWGNEAETTLPPIAVMPLLVSEFQKPENWLPVLPPRNKLLVTTRILPAGAAEIILHPIGGLKISQRAVPLGLILDKVGNQKPSDANLFDIGIINNSGLAKTEVFNESFAVGQFFDKSDDELLSAKPYEPLKGGVELSVAGEQYSSPRATKRVIRYEKRIIDIFYKRSVQKLFPWLDAMFSLFVNGNTVSRSPISAKQQKQLKPFADKIQIGTVLYVVAHNEDNTPYHDASTAFTSHAQAQEFLKQQIALDAKLADQLHVIPQIEMQRTG